MLTMSDGCSGREVRHVVFLKGVPQTVQPFLSYRSADFGLGDDGHEGLDGAVHR